MMQRNALAARLGRARSLPPMLRDERSCSGCFQRSNCALLHKASGPPLTAPSPPGNCLKIPRDCLPCAPLESTLADRMLLDRQPYCCGMDCIFDWQRSWQHVPCKAPSLLDIPALSPVCSCLPPPCEVGSARGFFGMSGIHRIYKHRHIMDMV